MSGQLVIANCPLLENLAGLENLKSISTLGLNENAGLKNLSGLENLDTIRLDFRFFENHALENLSALAGVKSALQGNIILRNNDALTALNGIGNMDFSMLKNLELTESAALAGCAQPNICAYLEGGGTSEINGNEVGCNSAAEVLAACTVGTISPDGASTFRVFPNPFSEDKPLQILLKNDFFGTVKIEVLRLDGRVLQTFFKEKIAENLVGILYLDDDYGSFFVRVSDRERTAAQLVFKL